MPLRNNSDDVERALERAASELAVRIERAAPFVMLIDGQSGAGKSTLARLVAERVGVPVQVLGLDEFYPGWDGLAAASSILADQILPAYRAGMAAEAPGWDWEHSAPSRPRLLDPTLPLVVEGAGALTSATAALADVTVWLSSPEPHRKQRALARDGDAYRPHWDRWAEQEAIHRATHVPERRADLHVDVP